MTNEVQCEPEQLTGRIIFMSMYGEIKKTKNYVCITNSSTVAGYANRFQQGHWSFLGPGSAKKWYGSNMYKPNGEWDVAEHRLLHFSESGHPVSGGTSALERGSLKSKGGRNLSVHFCGDTDIFEVVLRTIIAVNQLSVFGAVADMCDDLASRTSGCSASTARPIAKDKPEIMVAPTTTTNHIFDQ